MTTLSLTQCWPRTLWVTQVVCINGNNAGRSICERYFFLSERKSWRALNPTKREKLISKNREFKTEWTDKYAFVLPVGSTKPMCLICNETAALVKSGNVKRHYETKHAHLEQKYPQNSEVRGRKINHLQSYQATCSVIVRSATQQERAYLNIFQNQNHVYWPSTFSYTRNFFWV